MNNSLPYRISFQIVNKHSKQQQRQQHVLLFSAGLEHRQDDTHKSRSLNKFHQQQQFTKFTQVEIETVLATSLPKM